MISSEFMPTGETDLVLIWRQEATDLQGRSRAPGRRISPDAIKG